MQKQSAKLQRHNNWEDDSIYFLTDSTCMHYPYFSSDEQKEIILNQLRKLKDKFGIKISDYSISINHYHIKFYLKNGSDMIKIKQQLRGGISYEYRKNYEVPYNEMWQSRKIIPVMSEDSAWRITGYISGNILKHKEVGTLAELENNRFSSYGHWVNKYGREEMSNLVREVIGIDEDSWGNIDLNELNKARLKPRNPD